MPRLRVGPGVVRVHPVGRLRQPLRPRRAFHVPDQEVVVLRVRHHRSPLAVNLEARAERRTDRGGALHHPHGPVLEAQHRGREILHFDAVPPGGGAADHGGDGSHQVLQQVDDVDGLRHQAAAALERGGAAPRRLPVVGRGPAGLVEGVRQPDLPQPPAAQQFPEFVGDPPEAHLEDDPEPHSALSAVLHHPLPGFDSSLEGLFDQNVLPRVRRRQGHFRVEASGGRDDHDVHLGIGDQVPVVGKGARVPVLGGKRVHPLRVTRSDRGQEPALDELQLAGAEAARHPGPDQAEPDRPLLHRVLPSAGVRGR